MLYGRTLSPIMCMHDIIVIDDGNVEPKTGRAGQAKMYQSPVLYCSLFPVFIVNPACSVVYAIVRQVYSVVWIFKLLICTFWRPSA